MKQGGRIPGPGPEAAAMLRVFAGGVVISFSPVIFRLSGASASAGSLGRTLVGGLILLAVAAATRGRPFSGLLSPGALPLFLGCGALFTLDLEFWHMGISLAGPGLATILANFQVILLAVYGVVFFGEKAGVRLFAAILMALAGLWLLVGVDWRQLPTGVLAGVLWSLGAALWYSLFLMGVRKSQGRKNRLSPAASMAWISLFTAAFVGLSGLARGTDFSPNGTRGLLLLLAYGAGPQALGWLLISSGLAGFRASVAGLIILVQPTLAFVWDILFFDRPAGPLHLAGAGLALAGIYLGAVNGKKSPNPKPQAG